MFPPAPLPFRFWFISILPRSDPVPVSIRPVYSHYAPRRITTIPLPSHLSHLVPSHPIPPHPIPARLGGGELRPAVGTVRHGLAPFTQRESPVLAKGQTRATAAAVAVVAVPVPAWLTGMSRMLPSVIQRDALVTAP